MRNSLQVFQAGIVDSSEDESWRWAVPRAGHELVPRAADSCARSVACSHVATRTGLGPSAPYVGPEALAATLTSPALVSSKLPTRSIALHPVHAQAAAWARGSSGPRAADRAEPREERWVRRATMLSAIVVLAWLAAAFSLAFRH